MNPLATYQENTISTQSRPRLVVLLYDGAIKFLRKAAADLEAGDHESKARHMNRALDIIDELNLTLDMDKGGDIAQNLRKLYLFMRRHIIEGNAQSSGRHFMDVVKLLEELNSGWKEVTA